MAVGFVNIFVYGDATGVQAMLAHLQGKLSPPNLGAFLLRDVDSYLRMRVEERFDVEGDDVSGKWTPLESSTEMIRASQGFPPAHPINDRTGELRDYLMNSPSALSVNALGTELTYPGSQPAGELADKMVTAQSGKDFPETVPRPVLGLNEFDLASVLAMLAYEIESPL